MKQAIGELNGSIIVILAVGALSAFFFSFAWPVLKGGMENRARCSDAICDNGFNANKRAYCYSPSDPTKSDVFECPYRG
ncbi:MAG: hypothetical protein IJ475_00455 [Bacilli bacterium]|nr:hypothetical protein [Bacilli bacterium]